MATRLKLWVGIGACVLAGSGQATTDNAAAPIQPVDTNASTLLVASGGEGGEGGEAVTHTEGGEGGEASHGGEGGEASNGGEGGEGSDAGPLSHLGGGEGGEGSASAPAATESPGVYYANLLLMKGHLWIGQELYANGETELGAKHMGHPYEEQFKALEPALDKRGIDGVHEALETLAEKTGEQPEWSELESSYDDAQAALDRAIDDIDPELRGDADFIADVALGVLRTAAHEYGEAVKNGEFVDTVEYNDGRGFVHVTKGLLESSKATLTAADSDAYEQLMADMDGILAAWPSPMPPQKPAVTPSELSSNISRFELHANNL